MTLFHFSPPERGNEPLALQLELFPDGGSGSDTMPRSINAEAARRALPPGWWRAVATIFSPLLEVRVDECHEQDGELVLRVVDRDGQPCDNWIAQAQESARRLCAACGTSPAEAYRAHFSGPTRRVCASCRERLRNGESLLAIADEFFKLDGSRRVPPRGGTSTSQAKAQERASRSIPLERLSGPELRQLFLDIRASMRSEIVGHEDAVNRIALLGAIHVGGGLTRGGRAMVLGPTGSGKTSLVAAMLRAIAAYELPTVTADCLDLTAPGWSGAVSCPALVAAAIGEEAPASPRARKAIIVLDEIHHLLLRPDVTSNMAAKQREVMGSLLGLAGHGVLQLEHRGSWSSENALVIGVGAFSDSPMIDYRRSREIGVRELVAAGLQIELATRLLEDLIVLPTPTEHDMRAILREWPALRSLIRVCDQLGYGVRVHDETIRRAARVVHLGHDQSTLRTAGGWLVSALRQALIRALDDPDAKEIVVTPDSLPISPAATRPKDPPGPRDAPGDEDGRDARPPR